MSLLMFSIAPTGVTIVTDTLAATPEGRARHFTTKCLLLPHMGVAIAITGIANIGTRWVTNLNDSMLARDVEMLDVHTPEALRRAVHDLTKEMGPMHGTTTLYHFGRSEETGAYIGFAYRSTADFASDKLQDGAFAIKPPPEDGKFEVPSRVEDLIALASRVKAEQDALDPSTRLFIGGDLIMVQMSDGLVGISRIHRFDDYDAIWKEMNSSARIQRGEVEEV